MRLDPTSIVKIRESLEQLERAQNLLYGAARSICSVPGFGAEWSKLCKAGDSAKALWHKMEEKSGGFLTLHTKAS
jgi:hypothetical protein